MKPNEALKKANKSMNIQPKKKYGVAPELVKKESATSELKRADHDHSTLKKIDKESARYKRYDIKVDKRNKKKLRSPLIVGEVVFVLSSRFKKRMLLLYSIKVPRT